MVFFLDEQVVVRLVDNGNVELLCADQVRLGQGQVIVGLENLDDTAVVKTGSESGEQIGEQIRLVMSAFLLEITDGPQPAHLVTNVERDGLVGNLHVGNLDDDLLELRVVPVAEALHHGQSGVVGLIYMSAGSAVGAVSVAD